MSPVATWWPQMKLMWVSWKTQCVASKVVLAAWQSARLWHINTTPTYVLYFTAILAIAKVSKELNSTYMQLQLPKTEFRG